MAFVDIDTVAQQLETYIRERFRVSPTDKKFSRTVHLWDKGYVDSLGIAEVMEHIHATFGVKVPEHALFSEERTSILGLSELVSELSND